MEKMQMQQRNYGIDLLKIISMFMVVILHVLGKGGVLYAKELGAGQYVTVWFLEIAAYCAVNCFAMTTGYLMAGKSFSAGKIVPLWVTVFFYCLVIPIIFAIAFPGTVGIKELLNIFPVLSGKYWYFSAYFCMFFFIPLLNLAVDKMPEKEFGRLLLAGFLLLSGSLVIRSNVDCFRQENGYNAWWFSYLYLLGAGIKKYGYFQKLSGKTAVLGYLAAVLVTLLSKMGLEWLEDSGIPVLAQAAGFYQPNRLISYLSPTIVAAGVFLMTVCMKAAPGPKACRIMKWLSPLVFQVYIIHEHPLIRAQFIKNQFSCFVTEPPLVLAGLVLGTVLAIFTVCILIDGGRVALFRVLRIDDNINKLTDKVGKLIKRNSK